MVGFDDADAENIDNLSRERNKSLDSGFDEVMAVDNEVEISSGEESPTDRISSASRDIVDEASGSEAGDEEPKEAAATEETNTERRQQRINYLKYQTQYYRKALNFINVIQESIPVMLMLLGSKVKTDVLEAMDFFVTALEYKIENAEVGDLI